MQAVWFRICDAGKMIHEGLSCSGVRYFMLTIGIVPVLRFRHSAYQIIFWKNAYSGVKGSFFVIGGLLCEIILFAPSKASFVNG